MPVLVPITDCDESAFRAIANSKRGIRRVRLNNAWPMIEAQYSHYANNTATLEALVPLNFSSVRKADCRHCYEKETKPLGQLKAKLLKLYPTNGLPTCQYCLIGNVESVDHYAPMSKFPEFAILPRNLVPACIKCNNLKNNRWVSSGVREIFNLYYEDMPRDRYLSVNIDVTHNRGARIQFDISRPNTIAPILFERIARHYEMFNLIERYNTSAITTISNALKSARIMAASGRAAVAKYLEQFADGWESEHGNNYWEAIVYRSLANNNGFMALANI